MKIGFSCHTLAIRLGSGLYVHHVTMSRTSVMTSFRENLIFSPLSTYSLTPKVSLTQIETSMQSNNAKLNKTLATTRRRRPLHSPPPHHVITSPFFFANTLFPTFPIPNSHQILQFFFFFDNDTLLVQSVVALCSWLFVFRRGLESFWGLLFTTWFEGCTQLAR